MYHLYTRMAGMALLQKSPAVPFQTHTSMNNAAPLMRALDGRLFASRMRLRRPGIWIARRCKGGAVEARVSEDDGGKARGGVAAAAAVRGVLFDMDGVLCDSEERSREAAVDLFAELGVSVKPDDFIPFMGTGEANFLRGVASVYGLKSFDPVSAKKRFFEIYIQKYARPNSGLGYSGALDLILECKNAGLKLAVASSADRIKVDANLAAAGLPQSNFDAIVSADAFERLKPAPDIFLAAAKAIGIPPAECVVIEDAIAGIQAARAAGMRCIGVTTTLSEEKLVGAGPSLIRNNIASITLSEILSGLEQTGSETDSSRHPEVRNEIGFVEWKNSILDAEVALPAGFSTTRRDIMKLGSLGMGIYSLSVALTHWKAITYISPMAVLNDFLGIGSTQIASSSEMNSDSRVDVFRRYISDLESKGGGQQVLEFPPGLKWLNTTPLRFKGALRGKVVILDFWTYCCINCMHVLPDLAYLEEKYKDQPLTVVGVHSAKFDNEKDIDAIRNAVLRYNVQHPVVNDGDMSLWRQLGINSWPTFVVVSPKGKVLARLAGEGHRKDLDDVVAAALNYYGEKMLLNAQPIPQLLEKNKDSRLLTTPLSFPGKIATDLANGRLFISDSNHHRIVVTGLDGNFVLQVGSGDEGLRDGSFTVATFNRPQGIAYNAIRDVLYVADTENHALREIDFVKQTVKTLAGNGEKGADNKGGKRGSLQVLNSPWDVCFHPRSDKLYIAMAGQHQIWDYDTSNNVAKSFSGDGYERNLNGSRGSNSSYAQPSGVSLDPGMNQLYVADSESSSIRSLDLRTGGSKWLSGGDPAFAEDLFKFGDKDGTTSQALFQHPLGVTSGIDGLVYIADSYNHKIKMMNLANQTVKTVAGTGVAGYQDGTGLKAQFSEPAGLARGPDGTLFVADTNNNVIRVLKFGAEGITDVSTLELKGVLPTTPRRLRKRPSSDMQVVRLQPVSAVKGDLELQITLPPGFHFTKEATSKYDADAEPVESLSINPMNGALKDGQATLRFERNRTSTPILLRIISKVYYCQQEEVCLYKGIVFEVPFEENTGSQAVQNIPVSFTIEPQKANNFLPST